MAGATKQTGKTETTFSADPKQLLKALERAEKGFKRLEKSINKTTSATKRGGTAAKSAFGPKAIGKIATGVAGGDLIARGVRAVGQSFLSNVQDVKEFEKSIRDANKELEVATQNMIQMMGKTTPQMVKKVLADSEKLALKIGVPLSTIRFSLGDAFSASAGNIEQSFDAVEAAARQAKEQGVDAIKTLTGAVLDLSAATGSVDAFTNLALFNQLNSLMRGSDVAVNAKVLGNVMAGLAGKGIPFQTAGALFTSMTTATKDPTGQVVRTAVLQLIDDLDTFFRENKKAAKELGETTSENKLLKQIQTLRANPKLAAEISGFAEGLPQGLRGRAQVITQLRQLISDPLSKTAQDFDNAMENISGTIEELSKEGLAGINLKFLDASKSVGDFTRAIQTATEIFASKRPEAGIRAELDEQFKQAELVAGSIGATRLLRRGALASIDLLFGPQAREAAQIGELQRMSEGLKGETRQQLSGALPAAPGAFGTAKARQRKVTGRDFREAEERADAIQFIDSILAARAAADAPSQEQIDLANRVRGEVAMPTFTPASSTGGFLSPAQQAEKVLGQSITAATGLPAMAAQPFGTAESARALALESGADLSSVKGGAAQTKQAVKEGTMEGLKPLLDMMASQAQQDAEQYSLYTDINQPTAGPPPLSSSGLAAFTGAPSNARDPGAATRGSSVFAPGAGRRGITSLSDIRVGGQPFVLSGAGGS
jgi:hypothetical protein